MEETTKRDFTEVDIARALMEIPKDSNIILGTMCMEELKLLANDEAQFKKYWTKLVAYIATYFTYANAIVDLRNNLINTKSEKTGGEISLQVVQDYWQSTHTMLTKSIK